MAKKKSTDLRSLDDGDLVTRLDEARQELFNLRFQLVTGQLDNSARMGLVRRDIARIATILREREIEAAEALEAGTKNVSKETSNV
ncbi:MAG TPA: 50S ribosomal protein L29 [Acidimicrobiales bacterium]|nr:50S ribosomal protein L29 [Acidimicrobiales bacterium]